MPHQDFHQVLSKELFCGKASEELLDDLIFLEESFFLDRTWVSVSAIASPGYVKGMIDLGRISPATLSDYRSRRKRLSAIVERYADASGSAAQELRKTAQWILTQWQESPEHLVVDAHLGQ
jgi:hypothetical protein